MAFVVSGWIEEADRGELRLVGVRCEECGATHFPPRASCKRCSSERVTPYRLGPGAVLHSYTVDQMGTFLGYPHLVGQVRFPEGTFVQGFIAGPVDQQPVIGASVRLVPLELTVDDEPEVTYAFNLQGE